MCFFCFPWYMMIEQAVDILYGSEKLVIACLPRTIWPRFCPFLVFYYCFNQLLAREISRQNLINSENIGHIILGPVQ